MEGTRAERIDESVMKPSLKDIFFSPFFFFLESIELNNVITGEIAPKTKQTEILLGAGRRCTRGSKERNLSERRR
jgi:hypothetical protein